MKKLYFTSLTIVFLSLFCCTNQVNAQSAVEFSVDQICRCLDEKVRNDTLEMTPKEIFDTCTGGTMAKNREELGKEYDLGTVEGILELRDKFIKFLDEDCDRFGKMFGENSEG